MQKTKNGVVLPKFVCSMQWMPNVIPEILSITCPLCNFLEEVKIGFGSAHALTWKIYLWPIRPGDSLNRMNSASARCSGKLGYLGTLRHIEASLFVNWPFQPTIVWHCHTGSTRRPIQVPCKSTSWVHVFPSWLCRGPSASLRESRMSADTQNS